VQLGYSPRLTVQHTSHTEIGQIYVPEVNWALGAACVSLVLGFQTSSSLAAAYGIAVTGTMSVTTILFQRVARERWGWPRPVVWTLAASFLAVDLAFVAANLVKFSDGGWFPIGAAVLVFTLMTTWKRGRDALALKLRDAGLPLDVFAAELARKDVPRVPGTAVFMTSHAGTVPPVLLHHLKHNKVLHERVLLVSLATEHIPAVPPVDRATVKACAAGFVQVTARYGFMETPDVPALLASLPPGSVPGPPLAGAAMETTYYLGRDSVLPTGPARMARWRKRLFILMARNARTASAYFGLPPNRVVEMGGQILL
jgi:KUP system potassium uptake protein